MDLEKALDRVPQKVVQWSMRKLLVENWLVRVVMVMYDVRPKISVRVNGVQSEDFEVKVGVHQGSVLSPILFVMVLEAISQEFRGGSLWELLYADDLVLIADSVEEVMGKYTVWKECMEARGLKVNSGKTKVLISGAGEGSVEKKREVVLYCL